MIEAGEIKEKVEQIVNGIAGDLSVNSYELFRTDDLPHPVAGKGEQVPAKNEPQEHLELQPTSTGHPQPADPEEEISHADDKEYMADFVGNKPFGTAMLLNSPRLVRPQQGEG